MTPDHLPHHPEQLNPSDSLPTSDYPEFDPHQAEHNRIDAQIDQLNATANPINEIGFPTNTSPNSYIQPFHGFIGDHTKIRFSNFSTLEYDMSDHGYFHEFQDFLNARHPANNHDQVAAIEPFLNQYFGLTSGPDQRDNVLEGEILRSTTTDDEYWEQIESLNIADFKNRNIAMCTERAAMAQNLLTYLGYDSYYCVGRVQRGDHSESHAFNIVKLKNSYRLLDYSLPTTRTFPNGTTEYTPYEVKLSPDHIDAVLQGQLPIEYPEYSVQDTHPTRLPGTRTYTIGHPA